MLTTILTNPSTPSIVMYGTKCAAGGPLINQTAGIRCTERAAPAWDASAKDTAANPG